MVNQIIYLTDISKEAIRTLEEHNYRICDCCNYDDVLWFHFYYRTMNVGSPVKEVHGSGSGCYTECSDRTSLKCCRCSVHRNIDEGYEVHVFHKVERFIQFIEEQGYK